MRDRCEIAGEIAALRALTPIGCHAHRTSTSIALAIEELEYGVDDTAGEWAEMTDSQRDIVMSARAWKNGWSKDRPSTGWGRLVAS